MPKTHCHSDLQSQPFMSGKPLFLIYDHTVKAILVREDVPPHYEKNRMNILSFVISFVELIVLSVKMIKCRKGP